MYTALCSEKTCFCIYENGAARCLESTNCLLNPKYQEKLAPVAVQPGLCLTWSKTTNHIRFKLSWAIRLTLPEPLGSQYMHNVQASGSWSSSAIFKDLMKIKFHGTAARWLSGKGSDSGARDRGIETYLRRVVSLSRHFTGNPRKRWFCPDMTGKLLTGTFNLNTNKQKTNFLGTL